VRVNDEVIEVVPSPGSYFTLNRKWQTGDRVQIDLPMQLHVEAMPDEPTTQAFLYGPLVLAGKLGSDGLNPNVVIGPMGPDVQKLALEVPPLRGAQRPGEVPLQAASEGGSAFIASTQDGKQITFVPFDQLFGERYSVYWTVS
jgi:DUF1680 family protein